MKTKILLPACLFVFTSTLYAHSSTTRLSAVPHVTLADSVGIEKKDGKRFILHRVDQGQTLYAIARRYGRPVSDIKAANPGMGESVRYDQVVRIPVPDESITRKEAKAMDKAIRKAEKAKEKETTAPQKSGPVASTAVQPTARQSNNEARKTDDPARAGIHIVEPRQTLYSLAVQYGVSQSDLRKWNNLSANNVLIGQALIVSEKAYLDRLPNTPAPAKPVETPVSKPTPNRPAETRPTTSRPEPKPEKTPMKKPDETPATDSRPSAATVTKPAETAEPVESPRPGNDAPMPTYGRRIVVSGVAEMIDGTDESGKYLALHRTAPIGTLVQVRNAFNNQSLWVKVIGRLPNTGVNDKILIKLSAQAFAKLSPDDRRFRAEVSYIVK